MKKGLDSTSRLRCGYCHLFDHDARRCPGVLCHNCEGASVEIACASKLLVSLCVTIAVNQVIQLKLVPKSFAMCAENVVTLLETPDVHG